MPTEKTLPAGSIQITAIELSSEITGRSMNILPLVVEMNIYEDLMQPFITANFSIGDSLALTTWFPIVGQETITVSFRTPHPAFLKSVDLQLSVISLEKLQSPNVRTEKYVLRCVTIQSILDWNTRIRKSYRGPISEMVSTIVQENLGAELQTVGETDGNRTIVIPNMAPSKAIKFLCREARSIRYQPSNFVFYENADGFHFQTIEEMIAPDGPGRSRSAGRPKDKYYVTDMDFGNILNPSEVAGPGGPRITTPKPFDFIKIQSFEIVNAFDNRKALLRGGFESTIRVIDPVTARYLERKYDYFEDFRRFSHTTNTTENELLTQQNPYKSKYESKVFYMPDNSTWNTENIDTKPETIHWREASLALLDNLVVNISIPGDSDKRIGEVLDLEFPEFGATDDVEGKRNNLISGEYLIAAVRHVYNGSQYQTVMRCVKNAYQHPVEVPR